MSPSAAILGQAAERVGGSIKEKALPPLIKLLDEGEGADRRTAALAIRGFGVHAIEAIPVLRKSLFPSGTDSALFSAEALGKIGKPAVVAVPDLLKVLEEKAADSAGDYLRIREAAARSIGQIGPQAIAAAPRLLILLDQTNDAEFKMKLAVAVMQIDPPNLKALSEIEKIMRSPDLEQRIGMIIDLLDAGSDSRPALSIIKAAQNDGDSEVRAIAKRLAALLEKPKQ